MKMIHQRFHIFVMMEWLPGKLGWLPGKLGLLSGDVGVVAEDAAVAAWGMSGWLFGRGKSWLLANSS